MKTGIPGNGCLLIKSRDGRNRSDFQNAILVIAIASGATTLSHVNDSGFWLVKQYLGLSEKQTLSSWTVMTGLIAVCGLVFCWLLWMFS